VPTNDRRDLSRQRLLTELRALTESSDIEAAHWKADALLIGYINDDEIAKVYHAVEKWYSPTSRRVGARSRSACAASLMSADDLQARRDELATELLKDQYAAQLVRIYEEAYIRGYQAGLEEYGLEQVRHDEELAEHAYDSIISSRMRLADVRSLSALGPLVARGRQSDPPSDPPCPTYADGRHHFNRIVVSPADRLSTSAFVCACGKKRA